MKWAWSVNWSSIDCDQSPSGVAHGGERAQHPLAAQQALRGQAEVAQREALQLARRQARPPPPSRRRSGSRDPAAPRGRGRPGRSPALRSSARPAPRLGSRRGRRRPWMRRPSAARTGRRPWGPGNRPAAHLVGEFVDRAPREPGPALRHQPDADHQAAVPSTHTARSSAPVTPAVGTGCAPGSPGKLAVPVAGQDHPEVRPLREELVADRARAGHLDMSSRW